MSSSFLAAADARSSDGRRMRSIIALPAVPLPGTPIVARQYVSAATGLRAMLVQTDELICALQLVLATESDTKDWTHKDDGLPHTLEHLIFLGSELYPYKGILDKLANRSMAQGTNAWTATDHTCYTLDTAGQEGCLNMLPIYADHIFSPTLAEEGFTTEVHHLTGDGEDKGVVYCEMQGRENDASSLLERACQDLLFPDCGYSSETGGKMANLRTLTNAQVRRYHGENYRPDNAMLLVTGLVDEEAFLDALRIADARLVATAAGRSPPPAQRPWSAPIPPMVSTAGVSAPVEIDFPSDDESVGTVVLNWRACAYEDVGGWMRLNLLWEYLTESAVAPLTKALVECEEPLCGSLNTGSEVFSTGYVQLWAEDADVETIDQVPAAVMAELSKAAESFDAQRMASIIRLKRRQLLARYERKPADAIASTCLEVFLYGPRSGVLNPEGAAATSADLAKHLDMLAQYKAAESVSVDEWVALLRSAILEATCAVVIGRPSAALAESNSAEEEARVAAQRERLGEAKLGELESELQAAIQFNERPIPMASLTAVPIPDLSAVKEVPIATLRHTSSEGIALAQGSGKGVPAETVSSTCAALTASRAAAGEAAAPLWVEWSHFSSALLNVAVGIDTSGIKDAWRPRLAILLELIWQLPATLDGGSTLDKDAFVEGLRDETVNYSARLGLLDRGVSQFLMLFVQCEADEGCAGYTACLKWLRRALHLTNITVEEVRVAVQKLVARQPEQKRDGSRVAAAVLNELQLRASKSSSASCDVLRLHGCLQHALAALDAGGDAADNLVAELRALRAQLVEPPNLQVCVAGDVASLLSNRPGAYAELSAALLPPRADTSAIECGAVDGEITMPRGVLARGVAQHCVCADDAAGQSVVVSLASLESSYVFSSAPGLEPYAEDLPPLKMMIEYLTVLEGEFWVRLRGAGLTYGADLSHSVEERCVGFSLYRCTDPLAAYQAAQQIIADYASGESVISDVEFGNARASLAYSLIASKSNKLSAAADAWSSAYDGRQVDHARWLLEQIAAVTPEQALHALKRYIVPLFDGAASVISISTTTSKLAAVADGLAAERGGNVVSYAGEEAVLKWVGDSVGDSVGDAKADAPPPATTTVTKTSCRPFAFAAKFKCECAKCVKPVSL